MMQTTYYNVNRTNGTMIDLYQRRQQLAMSQMESGLWLYEDKPRRRRSRKTAVRRSELSELLASSGVLAVTIAGTVLAMCL
ncbi:MAG: hypothetical protein J6Q14_08685 [Oscillospiraceae bacterium]|nr:hypothetical protein [Oscillospiraceae bacterium]